MLHFSRITLQKIFEFITSTWKFFRGIPDIEQNLWLEVELAVNTFSMVPPVQWYH